MICECPVEEDLPHGAVETQVEEGADVSSLWLPEERKVYGDILLNEIYPVGYRRETFCEVFDDEKICVAQERGATGIRFGG